MNPITQELHAAFCDDDAARVKELLDQNPEFKPLVNEPVGPFASPAIVSARSVEMLDVLLAAGADINAKSRWWAGGFGLLHSASPELAAYAIERGAAVDIHAAARLGLLEKVQDLIASDSRLVHARGGDGQTPLHFANTVEIAACLLEHGADIDARDIDHESTPAQYMTGDRQEIARYLIGRGCQVDLLMASALGDAELVRRLLDGNPESIHLRVSDEFFPMVGGKNGGTIYQWTLGWYVSAHQVARRFHHEHVWQLLMDRSSDEVRLLAYCWDWNEAAARRLTEEQPGLPDRLNSVGRRQVAHAARNNDDAAVRLMLAAGFPANGASQHRGTALHWAAWHGNAEMVRNLLAHGAALEERGNDYQSTPLGWAIHGSENRWNKGRGDSAETVELLIRAGAELPKHASGSEPVRQLLRRHGVPDEEGKSDI